MIDHVGTVTVCVRDQERALAFYVDTLGWEKRDDAGGEGYRWLTVAPPGAYTQLYLAAAGPGTQHPEGPVGGQTGVMLHTRDLVATHADLVRRGVRFPQPPTPQPWGGLHAQLADADGNIFLLQQLAPA